MTVEEIIATAGTTGGIGGFGLWMLKRWMARIEDTLRQLAVDVNELKTSIAVNNERQANLNGRITEVVEAANKSTQNIGALTANVSRLWLILKSKGLVPKRFSDEALEG